MRKNLKRSSVVSGTQREKQKTLFPLPFFLFFFLFLFLSLSPRGIILCNCPWTKPTDYFQGMSEQQPVRLTKWNRSREMYSRMRRNTRKNILVFRRIAEFISLDMIRLDYFQV